MAPIPAPARQRNVKMETMFSSTPSPGRSRHQVRLTQITVLPFVHLTLWGQGPSFRSTMLSLVV
jgi:hypothetical protein